MAPARLAARATSGLQNRRVVDAPGGRARMDFERSLAVVPEPGLNIGL